MSILHHQLAKTLDTRFGPGVAVPVELPGAETIHRLAAHNSHRRYAATPVADDLLTLLYAAALSSPSKSDLQQTGILRVRDASKRAAISRLLPEMPWVAEAPVFLVFLGDHRRIQKVATLRGRPFANNHLDSFFNATLDAGIVLSAFIQAAAAAGLGTCPISAIRNHPRALGDLLELPPWVFPVAGLTVGYPVYEGRVVPRLPLDLSVHTDRYDDSGFAEKIDAYDRRRDAILPYTEQQEVEVSGTAGFYGWSEDKARQYSVPMREDFGAYIRAQGFDLT